MTKKNDTGKIIWNDKNQPLSKQYDDIYFSTDDGLSESEYVFIEGNNLPKRFQRLDNNQGFTVFETGFGTGLNFLSLWRCWIEHRRKQTKNNINRLHFISVEKHPLTYEDLHKAHLLFPNLGLLSKKLLRRYPPQPSPGIHRLPFDDNITISLIFLDLHDAIDQIDIIRKTGTTHVHQVVLPGETLPNIDACFLDGFSPQKNPDMWTEKLFNFLAKNSSKSTTISTFTAARKVKSELEKSGFLYQKKPGFGKKREMLVGTFFESNNEKKENVDKKRHTTTDNIWLFQKRENSARKDSETALVIGAGLAGTHIASELAQRGWRVQVLEKNGVAEGASSNTQGVVYCKHSPHKDALSQFNHYAQHFADHFYEHNNLYERCGAQCGVLHLSNNEKTERCYREILNKFSKSTANEGDYYAWVKPQDSKNLAGIPLQHSGLWLPRSGWLSPYKTCRALLDHPGISLHEGVDVLSIAKADGSWIANTATSMYKADICIICNAKDANSFEQTRHLKFNVIRGQVSHISTNTHLQKLKTVLCGMGYIPPTITLNDTKIHSVGATFNLNDGSRKLSATDHCANLNRLKDILYSDMQDDLKVYPEAPGKVGFRTCTPDYFPYVGPVPDYDAFISEFSVLSKKANAATIGAGTHHDGLYCSLGYGSRGLAYAPFCSQFLADLICGDFLGIPLSLYSYVHPARFIIRDIIRHKIPAPAARNTKASS